MQRLESEEVRMYEPKPILEAARAKPFRPFVLELSNGESLTIKHPDFIWVFDTEILVAEERQTPNAPLESFRIIGLDHVRQLKRVASTAPTP
jgi:hypothetical protein